MHDLQGFTWGSRPDKLLAHLSSSSSNSSSAASLFDLVLLSDLVFNHSQHSALLDTCEATTGPDGILLCFYAHHRPKPQFVERDEGFLQLARDRGWTVERIVEDKQAGVRLERTICFHSRRRN
jgi:nicotinamide N-methyltransferase